VAKDRVTAAIGLRAHSGWAALVSVIGPAQSPTVISRRRIVTADPSFRGSKQPYHFVESMSLSEASEIVAHCWKSSLELAAEELASEKKRLAANGFDARICAVLQGRVTELPPLEKILKAHPLLHTAEGVMFRQVLVMAAEACGMIVVQVLEKSIEARAIKELGLPAAAFLPRLTEMGRGLGSPWTLDQKYATAAAWLALTVHAVS
jgi:hypothetical protein